MGIRLAIDLQKAEIAAIHAHPVGAKVSFAHYEAFLESLLKLPIDDPVAQLPTWTARFLTASKPRPRRFGSAGAESESDTPEEWPLQDGVLPGKYWYDVFETGRAANDLVLGGGRRGVTAVIVAGSNGGAVKWHLTPSPSPHSKITDKERELCKSGGGGWARTWGWWRACTERAARNSAQ